MPKIPMHATHIITCRGCAIVMIVLYSTEKHKFTRLYIMKPLILVLLIPFRICYYLLEKCLPIYFTVYLIEAVSLPYGKMRSIEKKIL